CERTAALHHTCPGPGRRERAPRPAADGQGLRHRDRGRFWPTSGKDLAHRNNGLLGATSEYPSGSGRPRGGALGRRVFATDGRRRGRRGRALQEVRRPTTISATVWAEIPTPLPHRG